MTSPLQKYANSYLLIAERAAPVITNGRVISAPGNDYLVECYLVRKQSTSTTTGADYIPTQTSPGDELPGSSGIIYLYAGYALRYTTKPIGYEAGDEVPDNLTWISLTGSNTPDWLIIGTECTHIQGKEPPKYSKIERITGRYGNSSIDEIINKEIGGIPIITRSGDLID